MSSTPDCGADTAAYVLGALDAAEVDGFERHLTTCTVCQEEVESLRHTVSVLPMAAVQYPASKDLRRRVIRSVRDDAVAAIPSRRETPAFGGFGFGRGTTPRYGAGASFRPGLASAFAMAVLVLVVVVVGITASGSANHSKSASQVISASTGNAEVIVHANGKSELIVHKLGRLSPGQTYEVWVERAGGLLKPTGDLFNTDSSGYGDVSVTGDVKGDAKIMVTREPADGTLVPTHSPVVVATL